MEPEPRIEVELRYRIMDRKSFLELERLETVGEYRLRPAGERQMTDAYLDTPEQDLLVLGYALRIRTEGKRKLLTLKSLTPPRDALHKRQELETEVQGEDPRQWPAAAATSFLLPRLKGRALETLCRVYQRRQRSLVSLGGREVFELSLDEVGFRPHGPAALFELEVERIGEGSEEDLLCFGRLLEERFILQPEPRSKFELALAERGI